MSTDPSIYFLQNSFAFVAVTGILFFSLGLWFGWHTWARYKRRCLLLAAEKDELKHEVALLKRRVAEQASRATSTSGPPAAEQARHADHTQPDPLVESFISTASKVLGDAPPGMKSAAAKGAQEPLPEPRPTPKSLFSKRKKSADAPAPAKAAEDAKAENTGKDEPAEKSAGKDSKDQRKAARKARDEEKEAKVESIESKDEGEGGAVLRSLIEKKPAGETREPQPRAPGSDPLETGMVEIPDSAADEKKDEETSKTHGGSDAGDEHGDKKEVNGAEPRLSSDPLLGLVYNARPAQVDELTHLKGVASGIEGRLHEFGVYTYKQIALWSDENVREFSSLLAFKDRIFRERWVEQARELHFQKYGEKL